MKQLLLTALSLAVVSASFGQFKKLIVEEVDNGGQVPGKTYRIYAELTHSEDHVHAVYGDVENPMQIKSTKNFYQHERGGALSREVLRKDLNDNPGLKFDSWFTIGLEDNYVNQVNQFKMDQDLLTFEENGQGFQTEDGIWFATPDGAQVFAREKNRVLLMQLTSEGRIDGVVNLQGRTVGHYADGREFASADVADTERRRIGKDLRTVRAEIEKLTAEIEAMRKESSGSDAIEETQKKLEAAKAKLKEHEAAEKASGGEVWQAKGVTFTCGG